MSKLTLGEGVEMGEKKPYRLCIGVMTETANPLMKYPLESMDRNGIEYGDKRRIILITNFTESLETGDTQPEWYLNSKNVYFSKDRFTFSGGRNELLNIGEIMGFDYMLMLDSDEEMADNLHASLEGLLELNFTKGGKKVPFSISIENLIGEGSSTLHYVTRVIPLNERYRYVGRIHEQLVNQDGERAEHVVTFHSDNPALRHLGYTQKVVDVKGKYERNKNLLLSELNSCLSDKNHEGLSLDFIYFNLMINSYSAGEYKEGIRYFDDFRQLINRSNQDKMFINQGIVIGLNLCYFLKEFNMFYQVLDLYGDLECISKLPEISYLEALIHRDCDELDKARQNIGEYWIKKGKIKASNFPVDKTLDRKVKELENSLFGRN